MQNTRQDMRQREKQSVSAGLIVNFNLWLGVLLLISGSAFADRTAQTQGDFHLTLYSDSQGQLDDLELFTKVPDKEVYLGLTCSHMSPFPMVEVLLFNDALLLDSPALLAVSYEIDGKRSDAVALQGILKETNTTEEVSNKIRLEVASGEVRTMTAMQALYQTLLAQLKAGHSIEITLKHRRFGEQLYQFSLQGLSELLSPHESICR